MRKKKSETLPARIGKDEMNLAENPISWLTDRRDPTLKTLKSTYLVDGKLAEWVVTGSDEYGLPLPDDDDIFLILIQMTKEAGFKNRSIPFSRYEILRRLKGVSGPFNGRDYNRVKEALYRYGGVSLYATHWYDNRVKKHVSFVSGIFDEITIVDESPGRRGHQPPLRLSYITWSERFFDSFTNGYIKSLNLETYFSLKSSIAKKLYRFLDKKFYDGKPRFEIYLKTLAHEHLAASRNYQYDAHLKRTMEGAHKELMAAGLISGYEYRKGPQGTVVVYYPPKRAVAPPEAPEVLPEAREEAPAAPPLVASLVEAGISRDVAELLVKAQTEVKIREKLTFLPYAQAKNPGGWLRRAIEGDWQAPAGYLKEQKAARRLKGGNVQEKARVKKEPTPDEVLIDAIRGRLSPGELEGVEREAIEAYFTEYPNMRRTLGKKLEDPKHRRKVAGGIMDRLLMERYGPDTGPRET